METKIKNLSVFTSGDNNTKAILFVHGFPYDHRMWDFQVKEFSKDYNCITYDIRGLGQSPESGGQYTLESFVDDIESILTELKLQKPVLCGLSMGGYISLRAVERMEDKFSALILCDTKASADDNQGKLKRAAGIKTINEEGVEIFVGQFVPDCFGEKFVKEYNSEYLEILNRSKQSSAVGVKGCLLAMAGRTDTTSYLQKISIPTLVIGGKEDKLTPPDIMKSIADNINNSKLVLAEDSGHMTPIEAKDVVNKSIREFLSGLSWSN